MRQVPSQERKLILKRLLTGIAAAAVAILFAEAVLRIAAPRESLYPRWEYCPEYGHIPYRNCRMIHQCGSKWKFIYTVNRDRCRGKLIPVSNLYSKTNIVVLGDSYTFGEGVNDGEEYPSVLAANLDERFDVVNLGCAGWGLTQQIRRYYEVGRLYDPEIVILQFCANDPGENLRDLVTVMENGRFIFRDSDNELSRAGKWLSHSVLQKSQVYTLIRLPLYNFLDRLAKHSGKRRFFKGQTPNIGQYYEDLLSMFAQDLRKHDVDLLMISVTDQLDYFPQIIERIEKLEQNGFLEFVDTSEWLNGIEDYSSPEGHDWGEKAHRIIGSELAKIVTKRLTKTGE